MSKTILIIEDEKSFVELIKYRFKASGYEVKAAFNGEEGLKKMKKLKPDIVILDVMMPKMHGYDVCRLAKSDAAIKNIPIIVLTARKNEKDLATAKEAGADAFITKPFEPKDLMAKIKELIK